jgi:hypothetical protein
MQYGSFIGVILEVGDVLAGFLTTCYLVDFAPAKCVAAFLGPRE